VSVKRDYKPASTSQKKRRQVRRYGLLVITLALVAVFGSFLAYISGDKEDREAMLTSAPGSAPAPKQPAPGSIQLPEASKPKYDFYKVLPERQVVIPDPERTGRSPKPVQPPPKPAARPKPKPAPKAKAGYVVQAGSFSKYGDADRIKASLALLGVSARIEIATGANGKKLHRVRVGPLAGFQQAEAVRQRLRNNNIQAITIKTN
jgi:cell division protein FtsN